MTGTHVGSSAPAESPRMRRALDRLEGLLVAGEQLEATAIQRRIFALAHRRQLVGATSGRLLVMRRRLLGGYVVDDIRWQDLQDATLREGVLASVVTVTARGSSELATASPATRTLVLGGLRKRQAQAIYRICQAQEQSWREKRRVRALEELRARSGAVRLTRGADRGIPPPDSGEDALARLSRAGELLQKGLITDAEYEAVKARLVSAL